MDLLSFLVALSSEGGGGGGGSTPEIKSVELNNDGTYTVIDQDNVSHTLTVTETNGVITNITYDSTSIDISFDGSGNLISVGDTTIDVSNYIGTDIELIKSAILNSNKSMSVTYIDNTTSQVVPTYDANGAISSITIDGVAQSISYDANGYLTGIGTGTVSGMNNYPEPPISSIGYVVTFIVNDETYYVVSVEQGNSISAPPNPTVETGTFISWQINGSDVTFPYTPSADVTMVANIQSARTEMEIANGGNICTVSGNAVTNSGSDFVIVGVDNVGHTYIFIASKSAVSITGAELKSPGTYDHDGETWYYGCLWSGSDISDKAYIYPTPASQIVDCVQMLIEHYYLEDV